ncbi:MAG: polysaccharide biosynthesis tyrosine autokinase [Cyanobacteriota bacterium]|nr:polysaccharide biosynthesis tyrosine autokinase [Cyanobacteriota bacterium]
MQRDIVALDSEDIGHSQFTEELEDSSSSAQGGLKLGPILRTVKRKFILIAGVAGISTMAANQLIEDPPQTYVGNFQILVEPVTSTDRLTDPRTLNRTQGNPNDNLFNVDYPTQLEILKSSEVLDEVVDQVQTQYPEFTLKNIQSNLVVERLIGENRRFDQTKILNIKYEGLDPNLVQLVLDAVENRYLEYSEEERRTGIDEGIEYINSQLPDLERRVNSYQVQLQKLQQDYQLFNPQVRGEELYEQVRLLEAERDQTGRELREARIQYNNLQAKLDLTPEEAIAASSLSEAPNRSQLLASLTEIENEIAKQSAVYNDDTPEMQLLFQQRDNIRRLLDQETQRVLGQNPSSVSPNSSVLGFQSTIRRQLTAQLVEVSNQIQMLEARLAGLEESQSRLEQQAQIFPSISRRYGELQQQLELANGNLKRLLEQREKLRLDSAQDSIPWEIISQPQVTEGETDGGSKKLIMGLGGGLALGIGLALLIERLHNIFYTPIDLKDAVNQPLLGVIPRQRRQWTMLNLSKNSQIQVSRFMDAFDNLYANIRFLYGDAPLRSLAVCSAESGDGKSTVALHLAQTIASMGQKVLIVDANLRRPQLHQSLGLPNQKGLSNLLVDTRIAPSVLIQQSAMADNLFALTAGTPTLAAIKLMGSTQMQHIVDELQKTFDLVIYDTSQLGEYTDATFLAGHLDGLILVVGVAKTHQTMTRKVLNQLEKFHLPCLGVVANRCKRYTGGGRAPYLAHRISVHNKKDEIEQLI